MLVAGSTTVVERMTVTGSTARCSVQEFARIGDPAAYRGRGRGGGTREQRARALALAPLEIAVAGADAVFTGFDGITVHPQAHRAAGLAPLGAGIQEYLCDAARFGLALHALRARHDQYSHTGRGAATGEHLCREPQLRQSRGGPATDGHGLDRRVAQARARLPPPVRERRGVRGVGRAVGYAATERDDHAWVGAVSDQRLGHRG